MAFASAKRTAEVAGAMAGQKKPKLITDFFSQAKRTKSDVKVDKTGDTKVAEKHISSQQTVETVKKAESISEVRAQPEQIVHDENAPDEVKYQSFCTKYSFDKQKWVDSLTPEQRRLLDLEIRTLHITWLVFLHKSLTKPYFLNLKKFLFSQSSKTVFPPQHQIYSWSHHTPLPSVKCLVLGQDPYHNYNQAHGLAFSVLEPTRPPPSLLNIYKTIAIDYPNFQIPEYNKLAREGRPGGGNLTQWAKRGVLMLNAVLTVECHKANSHANRGWETFTEEVIRAAISYHQEQGFVIMAWGSPAQKRVASFSNQLRNNKFLVLRTVHPSPLSASRGFFDSKVFKKCNEWLEESNKQKIDWGLIKGNVVE